MKKHSTKGNVYILAIESSCDETAATVTENGREVLSNIISSRITLHALYGGAMPEIASRKHIEKIDQVIQAALDGAGMTLEGITAIGVTYGPELMGTLLVGVVEAKAVVYAAKKPLVGVHHIEGHVSANFIEHPDLEPPFIYLIVSGGHTYLVVVEDCGELEIIGQTKDDAVGGAFDRMAKTVGLGYPGGPKVNKVAREGDKNAIKFPRTKVGGVPYDPSFSGLESTALNHTNYANMMGGEIHVPDSAASFQHAVVGVLVDHAAETAKEFGYDKLAIAGDVASNSALRGGVKEACGKAGITLYYPSPVFYTDNAAMIDVAAYYECINGTRGGWDLSTVPSLRLGEW